MTVPASDRRDGPYTGTGLIVPYTFSFKVFEESDLLVVRALIATGVTTNLVLNSDYRVVMNVDQDNNPGGSVYYQVSGVDTALPVTDTITIAGNLPFEQPTDITNLGGFYPQVIEDALDRTVMLVQQNNDAVSRSLQLNIATDPDASVELPAPTGGAVIGWAGDGLSLVNYANTGNPALLAQLADTTNASNGAGLSGFDWSLVYAQLTSGWGIRSAANATNVLRYIPVSLWAAILNGTSTTDVSTQVQTAINALSANGGGDLLIPGKLRCNTPIRLLSGVGLVGLGRDVSIIEKDSTTTLAVTVTASALSPEVYAPSTIPTNINAVIVLDGTSGRYRGRLFGLSIRSTLATPGNNETQKAEFGVISIGSVSEFSFEQCRVSFVQYGAIFPVIFASEGIQNNLFETCLRGLGIDNGTSCPIIANYANNCRDYGFAIRDHKYSDMHSNACDYLNRTDYYPTRTRTCAAYKLIGCIGLNVHNNGDENTWGRSFYLADFRGKLERNVSIFIGSDYTGSDEIAWIYSTNTMRQAVVRDNFAYSVKSGGLIYGGANSAKHHNIYFEGLTFVDAVEFNNNIVASTRNSNTEAGWGNNVPTTWINAARGGSLIYTHSPTLQAQVMGNLSVVYGAENIHYIEQKGKLLHVWGCFHVTVTHTTASGLLIINGFQANNSVRSAAFQVPGVGGGSGLAVKLGWFEMQPGSTGALGRTDGDVNFTITDIPTGTTVRIFYDGTYELP